HSGSQVVTTPARSSASQTGTWAGPEARISQSRSSAVGGHGSGSGADRASESSMPGESGSPVRHAAAAARSVSRARAAGAGAAADDAGAWRALPARVPHLAGPSHGGVQRMGDDA